jgi:hypothetical protein
MEVRVSLTNRTLHVFRLGRRLIVGIVIAYAAVVLTLGGTAPARPVCYGLAAGWVLLLGLFAYLSIWRNDNRSLARTRSTLRLLELISTNIALILLLAEGSLRAFGAWSGNPFLIDAAIDGYRLSHGQDYGGGLRGNSLGYPGPEFQRDKRPGVYRIAALGDSFAIGPAVPFADNYLTVLERSLPGVEVYNFGVAGTGPREYLSILRRDVWLFQPDLILVSIFVGNDITESLATPRHLDPRQHALYLLCQKSWRLWWGSNHDNTEAGVLDRCKAPPLSREAFREIEARRLAVCRRSIPASVEKKWTRAFAYLDSIIGDCRQRGVPLAVALIPDEFQVNPKVLADALAEAGVGADAADIGLPQARLRAFFHHREVPCLDLLDAFTQVPDTYAPCDTHWNILGNRLAAEQLRDWLLRQNITLHAARPGTK